MLTAKIKLSKTHQFSPSFSLQQEHLELYIQGKLFALALHNYDESFVRLYSGDDLAYVIGAAISNGRRTGKNYLTGANEFYYLAPREIEAN